MLAAHSQKARVFLGAAPRRREREVCESVGARLGAQHPPQRSARDERVVFAAGRRPGQPLQLVFQTQPRSIESGERADRECLAAAECG